MMLLGGQPAQGVRIHRSHRCRAVGMSMGMSLLLGHHHLLVLLPSQSVTATNRLGTGSTDKVINIQVHLCQAVTYPLGFLGRVLLMVA